MDMVCAVMKKQWDSRPLARCQKYNLGNVVEGTYPTRPK